MGDVLVEIGSYLRELRGDLSLREAAKRSGLSHSYIDAVEKGKHPKSKTPIKPSPESLEAFAKAYGANYKMLMKVAGYIESEEKESEYGLSEEDLEFLKKAKLLAIENDLELNDPAFLDVLEATIDIRKRMLKNQRK